MDTLPTWTEKEPKKYLLFAFEREWFAAAPSLFFTLLEILGEKIFTFFEVKCIFIEKYVIFAEVNNKPIAMENAVIVAEQQGNLLSTTNFQNITMEQVLDMFATSIDIKPSSRELYKRTLRQYFKWVEDKGYLLREMSIPQLIEYKDWLLESGKSSLTISSYITSIRKFYEWAEANRFSPNIAAVLHSPRRRQQFRKQPLKPEQATQLLEHFTNQSLRDFAMVNLLLRTGLRCIEVVRADIGDITFKGGQRVLLVQGKGRDEKDNFVVLTDKAYKPIEEYLSSRKSRGDQEPLFACTSNNNKGGRLTTRAVSSLVKESLRAIGLDDRAYSAHSLRHTAAVSILRASNWNIEIAQRTLRHSNPATTQIYTETAREEERLSNAGERLLDNIF